MTLSESLHVRPGLAGCNSADLRGCDSKARCDDCVCRWIWSRPERTNNCYVIGCQMRGPVCGPPRTVPMMARKRAWIDTTLGDGIVEVVRQRTKKQVLRIDASA